MQDGLRTNGVDEGEFGLELCTSYREELLMMGVTILLFARVAMKKTCLLLSWERRQCSGIKYWDILERRAFKHFEHCMLKRYR